jgi:uncharacterized protein involved in outer membrane biogenesis
VEQQRILPKIRHRRLWLCAGAVIVLLPIVLMILVASFDWNRARPWLQKRIGAAIGRDVVIDGDLVANWHWRNEPDEPRSAFGIRFTAKNVRIGNPPWAARRYFAQLQAIDVDMRVLPILLRELSMPSIRLIGPSLDFERRKDDSNNWTFAFSAAQSDPGWTFDLGQIEFDAGEVTIADAERGLDLRAEISALDAPVPFGQHLQDDDPSTRREVIQRVGRAAAKHLHDAAEKRADRAQTMGRKPPPPYRFAWKAKGTLQGAKVEGNGRFGGVLALKDPSRPFPIRADIDVGATEIALTGTITDPTSPDAIDMRLWITGPNLAQLYPIAGLVLPETPPYATVGRLSGHFHPHRSLLRYQDFSARIGGSDLEGTLTYKSARPRATLTGHVDSALLQLKDLGALIGSGPASAKAARGDTSPQPASRVLPDEPFNVERWHAMDADVRFTGQRIVRTKELPIRDVETRIVMKDAVLTLDPLAFGMAGGNVRSSLRIDANPTPPQGRISLDARKLQLRRLFESVDGLSSSLGEVNASARLAGRGNSIADLLGASDGSLKLLMTDGKVSEVLVEKAGLNIANVVLSKLAGDRQIGIDCAAADFTAKQGVLATNLFVFDTDSALIDIDGRISLADEKVDLTLHPHSKGLRVFSLRSPLHVEGDFQHVDVSVDRKRLFLRGGAAIGLGLVAAPLAALLPLIAPGGDAPKSCATLVAQANQAGSHKAAGKPQATAKSARPDHRRVMAAKKPAR